MDMDDYKFYESGPKPRSLTADEVAKLAAAAGWSCDGVLAYDEDGSPGFVWLGPAGEEVFVSDHEDGPEPPDEFWLAFDPVTKRWADEHKASAAHLADTLAQLAVAHGEPTIAVSEFARSRHTRLGGKTYWKKQGARDGEQFLVWLVAEHWGLRKPGAGRSNSDDVVIVPLPPEEFVGTTVTVTPDMILTAKLECRQPGEEPFVSVKVDPNGYKPVGQRLLAMVEPDPCKFAWAVLYNRRLLTPEELEGCGDAEWVVVSLGASDTENEPMHPLTMSRNFLQKTGGTAAVYTAEQFAESVWYWSRRCGISPVA